MFRELPEFSGAGGAWLSRCVTRVCHTGHTGVDIFFGISGFLICSRLLAEREESGRIDLVDFYIRRSARIFPPQYLYLLIIAVLCWIGIDSVETLPFVAAATFWRNLLTPRMGGGEMVVSHTWSLAIEEHFYLLWPGLLIVLGTRNRGAWAACGLGFGVAFWRAIAVRLDPGVNLWRTDLRLDGLLFGAWLATVLADPTWRERVGRWLSPAVLLCLAGFFLIITLGMFPIPVVRLWISLSVPLLLAGTLLRPTSTFSRLLESAAVRWVGRLSYSLYLWQQLFMLFSINGRGLGAWQRFPLNWVASFVCAIASYYLIERPAIGFGRKVSARWKERLSHTSEYVTTPRSVAVATSETA